MSMLRALEEAEWHHLCRDVSPEVVLFDCIRTWRAQIRAAGNLNLSINPGLEKFKCFS